MADYIFTQNGDNNVQIGDMSWMPYHVNTALKWALGHNFQSVAAQYSKTLALEVVRLREDSERLCSALQSSKKRAADYEDTGLTPDEIAAMRAENVKMSDQIKRIHQALNYADRMRAQVRNLSELGVSNGLALGHIALAIEHNFDSDNAALTQHDADAQDGRGGSEWREYREDEDGAD